MSDVEKLKKSFVQKYAQCHIVEKDGKHKTGLKLCGLFGQKTGQAAGFSYTDANKNKGITWREDTLMEGVFGDSQKVYPGTKIIFIGIKRKGESTDWIAYLKKSITSNSYCLIYYKAETFHSFFINLIDLITSEFRS
ncbi:cytochrome c-like [Castor canadensis]|jgi:cytochrome c|uniref:Cytochrome c-like n=2 Tax=Castor canadensis TaxID=51338 RepID=A0AC58MZM4_CASCN|nr:cytochrome c-like [Castor canadensis]